MTTQAANQLDTGSAPLSFFYTHLHDAIRAELETLSALFLKLESSPGGKKEIETQLAYLRGRYRFLEQVYKYHSSVEDEVVYPALDSKVKNVTLAYIVEHEDEEHLLEELSLLLSRALTASRQQPPSASENLSLKVATLPLLARKVEEIHTTLRKHLSKEEEQLLPLLLKHFSFREQAELVSQFLCCIPLAAVDPVLSWLKRSIPLTEQSSLLEQVRAAVPDHLLRELLVSWLEPQEAPTSPQPDLNSDNNGNNGEGAEPSTPDTNEEFVCCRFAAPADPKTGGGSRKIPCADVEDVAGHLMGPRQGSKKPPLREILYFHRAIRSALSSFAEEARALRGGTEGVSPAQLTALVERHRFIRAVCAFHSSSEDEVLFPALRKVERETAAAAVACSVETHCELKHIVRIRGAAAENDAAEFFETETEADAMKEEEEEEEHAQCGPITTTTTTTTTTHTTMTQTPMMYSAAAGHFEERHRCEDDHAQESAQFEELGRLLGDVKACVRRGAKHVAALTDNLSTVSDRLARGMSRHMAREESEVLPVLMKSLCAAEQRHMVWRIMRAMPLRLLERVMPWVAGKLRAVDVTEWLDNIRRAAPPTDAPLVELLSLWAARGRRPEEVGDDDMNAAHEMSHRDMTRGSSDDPTAYSNETCGGASLPTVVVATPPPLPTGTGADGAYEQRAPKRIRTEASPAVHAASNGDNRACDGVTQTESVDHSLNRYRETIADSIVNPIDHIFQFHKALRRELKDLELAAVDLQSAANATSEWAEDLDVKNEKQRSLSSVIQSLQARFQFLRGIYRAHSSAEDEIVFPALESKEALHNVSHAYTLDHKQEESLFEEVAHVIRGIGGCVGNRDLHTLRSLASKLARMCAAVRASLETHVRAEETELWPLFAENFSVDEQQHLVGMIIGRTGAEVLHSMLSWVQGEMTQEESDAMMLSLKTASKATAFEQWLGAALEVDGHGGRFAGEGSGAVPQSHVPTWQEEQRGVLAEVAGYLAKNGVSPSGGGSISGIAADLPLDPGSLAADAVHFRPGWEDIFRMNQKQLEAAVRRVSADPTLEPQRKAYLIQHLMASRYIVAQQRRMVAVSSLGATPAATPRSSEHPPADHADHAACCGDGHVPAPSGSPGPTTVNVTSASQRDPGGPAFRHSTKTENAPSARDLGCRHYRRNAVLIAPCCGGEFVCRFCHDETLPDHQFDRFAVTEMRCMLCGTRQAVGQSCVACGTCMARYYCGICHLFDDDPHRDIYHCPFCNFCRTGKGLGADSFHCMSCNACMSLELFNKHRCTEGALSGTCPVCSDPLFESKSPIKELPCGHFMHSLCFGAYTRYSYTCPVCSKSLGDMGVYWKMIDALLSSEVLPSEYASRRQRVKCNDCEAHTDAPFHFVYHRCGDCGGYNTRLT